MQQNVLANPYNRNAGSEREKLYELAITAGFAIRQNINKQFIYTVNNMTFFIFNGLHVFIVCGKQQQFTSFRTGIKWAFTTKTAARTEQLIGEHNGNNQ